MTTVLHLAERTGRGPPRHSTPRSRGVEPGERNDRASRSYALHPLDAPPSRLAFAQWLVDKRSPLTARVAVNRLWQAVFGTGIVETAEDFGTRAPEPSHRELLDWLAVDFMTHGWSQKQLLRTFVTSDAYLQNSQATPELIERDPKTVCLPVVRVSARRLKWSATLC